MKIINLLSVNIDKNNESKKDSKESTNMNIVNQKLSNYILQGSQRPDCDGSVNVDKLFLYVNKLNNMCEKGVSFEIKTFDLDVIEKLQQMKDLRVKKDYTSLYKVAREFANYTINANISIYDLDEFMNQSNLTGGTCTAMAFDFIKQLLKSKKNKELLRAIKEIGPRYKTSNEKFRTKQKAFNYAKYIGENKTLTLDTFKINKIQSIANFYGIHTIPVLDKSLDITKDDSNYSLIENVDPGIYLLRLSEENKDEKIEVQGHSMVYVKDKFREYFYDPNFGISDISQDSFSLISYTLQKGYEWWGIHSLQIYKCS